MIDEEEWDISVTWCIEDFTFCPMKTGEELESPDFTVGVLDNSKWNLSVYPNGWKEEDKEYFSCLLYKNHDYISKEDSDITFKFQISTAQKKVLQTFQGSHIFKNGDGVRPNNRIKREELITELRKTSSDTLFIFCSLRRNDNLKKLSLKKELRTRLVSQKYSFKWKVKIPKFPRNISGKRCFSLGDQFYQMKLAIPHEDVIITLRKLKKNVSNKMVLGKVALIDIYGSEVSSKRDTFIFDAELEQAVWEFPSLVTKTQLIDNASEYEKDGKIMLLCEFCLYEEEEKKEEESKANHIFDNLFTLSDDFRSLLVNKTNFDVKLVVENNVELQAHRIVLATRSPVFSAMFDRDMSENRTGVVKIEDIDSKTLEFFLMFLYTGVVEDLDGESATKLLLVAEKYEVATLKETCAHFLMSAFSVDNVCEILTVADMVRHELLKNACLDYVAHHATEVLPALDFSEWAKDNIELSIETTLYCAKTVGKS